MYCSLYPYLLGLIDETNLVSYIPNMIEEIDCFDKCRIYSRCQFYTYYTENDPLSGTCILLSKIMEPLEECPSCVTGPVDCFSFDLPDKEELIVDWF